MNHRAAGGQVLLSLRILQDYTQGDQTFLTRGWTAPSAAPCGAGEGGGTSALVPEPKFLSVPLTVSAS